MVAVPLDVDVIVTLQEPPVLVVHDDDESRPRLVTMEMGTLAWLVGVWTVIVDDVLPSAGIDPGFEETVNGHEFTVTCTFGVLSPNQVAPSCTICHWKLYVPGVIGAVTVKLKVYP